MNVYKVWARVILRVGLITGLLISAQAPASLIRAEVDGPPLAPLAAPPLTPYLVKDINQATGDASPDLSHAQWLGGKALFWADDGIGGTGLWKSDGTGAGTALVKYISLGPEVYTCEFTSSVSATTIYLLLTPCGSGTYYFESSLWRSDGTPQGTWEVFRTTTDKKIFNLLFQLNDRAFLSVWDSKHGTELWMTDGAPGSMALLMDVYPGEVSGVADYYGPKYVVLNGIGYFTANDQIHGPELWRTDGTLVGTRMVKDISADKYVGGAYGLTVVANRIFFWVWDGTQYALWSSDGTAPGTRPAGVISGLAFLETLIPFQGNLYFFVADAAKTISLWRSDGTVSGTKRVKTFPPALDDARPDFYSISTKQIVFELTGVNSLDYWASDGTEAGTYGLKSFVYDRSKGTIPYLSNIATLNDKFYFVKNCDVWETAGTQNSTRIIETLWSRYDPSDCITHITDLGVYYTHILPFNNAIMFVADTPTYGEELWKTSGLPNSAILLKDINASSEATTAHVNGVTDLNGTLFFSADDRLHGAELWRSDGTYTGTTLVKDIHPGVAPSFPYGAAHLVSAGNQVFFTTPDENNASQLWRSDGTPGGTFQLTHGPTITVTDAYYYNYPFDVAVLNDVLLFRATEFTRTLLWRSDGTLTGTYQVSDIVPSSNYNTGYVGSPHIINNATVLLKGELLYSFSTGYHGYGLAKTDGTTTGTVALTGDQFRTKPVMLHFKDQVFFFTNTNELWRSDGTGAGTQRVATLPFAGPGYQVENIKVGSFVATANMAYFVVSYAYGPSKGLSYYTELWQTDGTPTGTKLIRPICAYFDIGTVNDKLVITAVLDSVAIPTYPYTTCSTDWSSYVVTTDQSDQPELTRLASISFYNTLQMPQTLLGYAQPNFWISDGTPLGTRRLMTVTDQIRVDETTNVVLSGNHLFFSAYSPKNRYPLNDLWAAAVSTQADWIPEAPTVVLFRSARVADLPVALTNFGATTAPSLTLTAKLPLSFTYVSDTSGITPTLQDGSLIWQLTGVKFLQQKRFFVTLKAPDSATVGTRYPLLLDFSSASFTNSAISLNKSLTIDLVIAHQTYFPLSFR